MYKPLVTITTLLIFAGVAGAQDDAQYKAWMMTVNSSFRAIRGAADNAAAAADATKLADTFDKVAEFWRARHTDDAVKLAETARDAAKAIASGSGDKAANVRAIQGTCGACHSAHREGTAPNFKIK